MMWWVLASAAAQVAAPAPSAVAGPQTVAEFLAQADALMAKGADAPAPEADVIRMAIQEAAMAYRASLALSAERGESPTSCPPPLGQGQLSLGDMISYFSAFPQANRAMPLPTAFALVMTLRFPCPASGG